MDAGDYLDLGVYSDLGTCKKFFLQGRVLNWAQSTLFKNKYLQIQKSHIMM